MSEEDDDDMPLAKVQAQQAEVKAQEQDALELLTRVEGAEAGDETVVALELLLAAKRRPQLYARPAVISVLARLVTQPRTTAVASHVLAHVARVATSRALRVAAHHALASGLVTAADGGARGGGRRICSLLLATAGLSRCRLVAAERLGAWLSSPATVAAAKPLLMAVVKNVRDEDDDEEGSDRAVAQAVLQLRLRADQWQLYAEALLALSKRRRSFFDAALRTLLLRCGKAVLAEAKATREGQAASHAARAQKAKDAAAANRVLAHICRRQGQGHRTPVGEQSGHSNGCNVLCNDNDTHAVSAALGNALHALLHVSKGEAKCEDEGEGEAEGHDDMSTAEVDQGQGVALAAAAAQRATTALGFAPEGSVLLGALCTGILSPTLASASTPSVKSALRKAQHVLAVPPLVATVLRLRIAALLSSAVSKDKSKGDTASSAAHSERDDSSTTAVAAATMAAIASTTATAALSEVAEVQGRALRWLHDAIAGVMTSTTSTSGTAVPPAAVTLAIRQLLVLPCACDQTCGSEAAGFAAPAKPMSASTSTSFSFSAPSAQVTAMSEAAATTSTAGTNFFSPSSSPFLSSLISPLPVLWADHGTEAWAVIPLRATTIIELCAFATVTGTAATARLLLSVVQRTARWALLQSPVKDESQPSKLPAQWLDAEPDRTSATAAVAAMLRLAPIGCAGDADVAAAVLVVATFNPAAAGEPLWRGSASGRELLVRLLSCDWKSSLGHDDSSWAGAGELFDVREVPPFAAGAAQADTAPPALPLSAAVRLRLRNMDEEWQLGRRLRACREPDMALALVQAVVHACDKSNRHVSNDSSAIRWLASMQHAHPSLLRDCTTGANVDIATVASVLLPLLGNTSSATRELARTALCALYPIGAVVPTEAQNVSGVTECRWLQHLEASVCEHPALLDILLAALVAALAAETSVVLLAAYILALVRIDGGVLALQNAAAELLHRRPEATRALLSDPTVGPSIVHAVHNALEQLDVHDCTDTASSNRTEPCGTVEIEIETQAKAGGKMVKAPVSLLRGAMALLELGSDAYIGKPAQQLDEIATWLLPTIAAADLSFMQDADWCRLATCGHRVAPTALRRLLSHTDADLQLVRLLYCSSCTRAAALPLLMALDGDLGAAVVRRVTCNGGKAAAGAVVRTKALQGLAGADCGRAGERFVELLMQHVQQQAAMTPSKLTE